MVENYDKYFQKAKKADEERHFKETADVKRYKEHIAKKMGGTSTYSGHHAHDKSHKLPNNPELRPSKKRFNPHSDYY